MMYKKVKRNYYTLRDILEFIEVWNVRYETGNRPSDSLFVDFLEECGYTEADLTSDQKSELADILWTENVVPIFRDCYAVYKDDAELTLDDIK